MLNLTGADGLKHLFARVDPLYTGEVILLHRAEGLDRLDNAAGHRIEAHDLRIRAQELLLRTGGNINLPLLQPLGQISEIEHIIDLRIVPDIHALALFGDARSDEYRHGVRAVLLLDHLAAHDHGALDRRQIRDHVRVILLRQIIDNRAAGREDIFHLPGLGKTVILAGDIGRRIGDLRRPVKAQRPECPGNLPVAVHGKVGEKRRSHRGDDPLSGRDPALDRLQIAVQRLGPLRALIDAAAAEQAVRIQNARLLIRKFD